MISEIDILNELKKDFPLQIREKISRESILLQLELRLSELLQQNAEAFFQLMYRLDISETKLTAALEHKDDTVSHLAHIIYDRQVERVASRKKYADPPASDDADLTW